MSIAGSRKRSQPSPPGTWQLAPKDHRRQGQQSPRRTNGGHASSEINARKEQESFAREQTRLNQIQEAEQMREWVSKEDEFVLQQSKKKAHIRVKEGRAKSIDWLAVTLGVIDSAKDLLDEQENNTAVDVVDPAAIFEGLSASELQDLGRDIGAYLTLESNPGNRRYWNALRAICNDYQAKLLPSSAQGRAHNVVLGDVERLLNPKTLKELESLEDQIRRKLQSNEPIDIEYWEQLLCNVGVYKARAELNAVYKAIISSQLTDLRQEQQREAAHVKERLGLLLSDTCDPVEEASENKSLGEERPITRISTLSYSKNLDPEPLLKLKPEDKQLQIIDEKDFIDTIDLERQRVLKLKYVPLRQTLSDKSGPVSAQKAPEMPISSASRFAPTNNEDFSSATKALYEREVARGVQEDEEIFAGEEEVSSVSKPQWADKYRPRKPRYFNRVQMGYEWNKYNQTHYDHENPPPKVVQGYKFNIFYPDLIDKVKAPTYRIERENGRKRGESFAPAGEEDTCLIRFISGPPYEDLAFRIVDKEWDYSAKRERGFRSSFDKGILQLHFQFKKVYYRK